jgi:hypothetical protein
MATSSKKAPKKLKKPNPLDGYVRLRTILDSLEIGALRFYLDGTTEPEKGSRLKEIETVLMPFIDKLWGRRRPGLIDCPRGYTECEGVCVPYSCVQGGGGTTLV